MSKIYIQSMDDVWNTSASIAASGSVTSGSFWTIGYSRLTGMLASAASAKAGSGLRIWQSCDSGSNYDYWTDYAPSACSGSGFSIEIVGNKAKIDFRTDANGASVFRTSWRLRPV